MRIFGWCVIEPCAHRRRHPVARRRLRRIYFRNRAVQELPRVDARRDQIGTGCGVVWRDARRRRGCQDMGSQECQRKMVGSEGGGTRSSVQTGAYRPECARTAPNKFVLESRSISSDCRIADAFL